MSSGGGKAKTPVLLNDNLKSKQFLRVLDLISEGPIYGPVDTEHMSSIMLNKTPVTNKNGDISINGVAAAWRNGGEYQEPINGFDYLESTVMVSNEVTKETPLVRTITNQEVNRVRLNIGVSSLVKTDSNGNQENSSVQMAIDIKSGSGGYITQKIVTIGPNKISGEYLEAHIIEAPEKKPFDLRVRRITDDSNSDALQNGTIWNSYTEITDDRLSYPYSAVVGVVIDRDQFKDTPTRNYHYRGIIVDIPDNYDPINRTYNGVWLGGFKQAWTNNPAWLYRALIKNNRYGLAKRVGFVDIDDGRLYSLSQFSDQLVNDGYGGKEPRFTLNAYLTRQEKAKALLDKIASSLRGSSVWDGTYFSMLIDMPSDPVALITNSNVIDGKFTRNSTPSDERYNAVIVSWVDPNNGWETSKEFVADDISIANDGYKETTIEAFGCTSRGQAHRVGKWILESSLRETGRISFGMARDAISFMPCDIVEIADNQHIGVRVGGRVVSKNKRIVTVDAPLDINDDALTLSMLGASGKPVRFDIDYIDGNKIYLLVEPEYFKEHSPFIVAARNLKPKLYRITSVKEEENNSRYKISATEHNPNKQAIVDEGAVFEQPSDTINGYRAPTIERLRVINVNSPTVQTTVSWESSTVTKDLSFEVRVYNNNGLVVLEDETNLFSYNFFGLDSDSYFVGVKAKNINGMKGAESQIEMNIGAPPKPSFITIESVFFGLKVIPYIATDNAMNTTFEFWGSFQSITNGSEIESRAGRLGRGAYWIKDNLKEGQQYWFYVRSVNPFGSSDFVEASGKPDNAINDIINEIGKDFLSTEAGKQLEEKIDLNMEKVVELESDGFLYEDIIAQHDTQLKRLGRASIEHSEQFGEITFNILAEKGNVRAEIKRQDGVIADEKEARAQSTELLKAEIGKNSAEIFSMKEVYANDEKSRALQQQLIESKFKFNDSAIVDIRETTSTLESSYAEQKLQLESVTKRIDKTDETVKESSARINEAQKTATDAKNAQTEYQKVSESKFDEHQSSIAQSQQTANSAHSAVAKLSTDLSAESARQNENINQANASLKRQDTVIATQTEALTQTKVELTAQLNENKSYIGRIDTALSTETTARTTAEFQLKTEIDKNTGAITRVESSVTTLQESVNIANQQMYSQINAVDKRVTAVDQKVDETKVTLEGAIAQSNNLLSAKVETAEGTANTAKTNAANAQQDVDRYKNSNDQRMIIAETQITDNRKAIANEEETRGTQINKINSQMKEVNSAIEQRAETKVDHLGNASSTFSITTAVQFDGQMYDAKMMIGAGVKDGKVVTQIGFSADTFAVFNPASGKLEPVFFIKDGQAFIRSAFIDQATIQELLIGSVIKSKNWDADKKQGMMLDFDSGKIIANNAEITGEITATSGVLNNVVISEDCEIKGTLKASQVKGDFVKTILIPPGKTVTIEPEEFDRIVSGLVITHGYNAIGGSGTLTTSKVTMSGEGVTTAQDVCLLYIDRYIYESKSGKSYLYIPAPHYSTYTIPANSERKVTFTSYQSAREPSVILVSKK